MYNLWYICLSTNFLFISLKFYFETFIKYISIDFSIMLWRVRYHVWQQIYLSARSNVNKFLFIVILCVVNSMLNYRMNFFLILSYFSFPVWIIFFFYKKITVLNETWEFILPNLLNTLKFYWYWKYFYGNYRKSSKYIALERNAYFSNEMQYDLCTLTNQLIIYLNMC